MLNHNKEKVRNHWKFLHGHSISSVGKSDTYKTWTSMHGRCNDLENENYGKRGIKVCDRWKCFDAFLFDMGERKHGLTIDRIDPNKNYTPENCRWSSTSEQAKNRRNSVKTMINGVELNLSDVAANYGIPETTVYRRYKQGLRGSKLVEKGNRNKYRVGEIANSKLTWDKVKQIRVMLSDGITQRKIAEKFNISGSVISEIKSNKTWKIEFSPNSEHYAKVKDSGVYDT